MANEAEAAKERAEARFKKDADRRTRASEAVREAQAEARATSEKTARLKALRLAKEAADLAAAPPATPGVKLRKR